jgi:hypothetical protein
MQMVRRRPSKSLRNTFKLSDAHAPRARGDVLDSIRQNDEQEAGLQAGTTKAAERKRTPARCRRYEIGYL